MPSSANTEAGIGTPLNGYKVVFVPFSDGRPSGPAQDVVTGFLDANNAARGRPVGLAVDRSGGLLIADDVGNTVWRVSSNDTPTASKTDGPGGRNCSGSAGTVGPQC